jgi:hypothetical protein
MDKKKIIIIAAVVVLVACPLVAFVVAKLFILPPSAEKVCEHMRDLMVESVSDALGGDEEAKKYIEEEMPIDECVKEVEEDAENEGLLDTKKKRDCVLDAETLEDMMECE